MEVSKVDMLVYPCWGAGVVPAQKPGVIGRTGIKVSYTRRASGAQRNIWKGFVGDINRDDSRLLVVANQADAMKHFDDPTGFYADQFKIVKYAQKVLGDRCYLLLDKDVGGGSLKNLDDVAKEHVLADRIAENGFYVSLKTESLTYGHHRGNCTINVGKNILASLGLNPDSLKEHRRASVASHMSLVREIVERYSPSLFAEIEKYEPQNNLITGETTVDKTRETCEDAEHAGVDSRLFHSSVYDWLFLTHTPLQVKHLVERVDNIDDLFGAIGMPLDISGHMLARAVCKLEKSKNPLG